MHKNPKAVVHPERSKLTTRWLTGKRFRYTTVGTTVPHIRANRRKTGFMPRFGAQAGRRPRGRAFVSGARQNTLVRAARERQFMKKNSPIQVERRWDAGALDELIDEFTVEAAGDDE
jgi:hypothetical protein